MKKVPVIIATFATENFRLPSNSGRDSKKGVTKINSSQNDFWEVLASQSAYFIFFVTPFLLSLNSEIT